MLKIPIIDSYNTEKGQTHAQTTTNKTTRGTKRLTTHHFRGSPQASQGEIVGGFLNTTKNLLHTEPSSLHILDGASSKDTTPHHIALNESLLTRTRLRHDVIPHKKHESDLHSSKIDSQLEMNTSKSGLETKRDSSIEIPQRRAAVKKGQTMIGSKMLSGIDFSEYYQTSTKPNAEEQPKTQKISVEEGQMLINKLRLSSNYNKKRKGLAAEFMEEINREKEAAGGLTRPDASLANSCNFESIDQLKQKQNEEQNRSNVRRQSLKRATMFSPSTRLAKLQFNQPKIGSRENSQDKPVSMRFATETSDNEASALLDNERSFNGSMTTKARFQQPYSTWLLKNNKTSPNLLMRGGKGSANASKRITLMPGSLKDFQTQLHSRDSSATPKQGQERHALKAQTIKAMKKPEGEKNASFDIDPSPLNNTFNAPSSKGQSLSFEANMNASMHLVYSDYSFDQLQPTPKAEYYTEASNKSKAGVILNDSPISVRNLVERQKAAAAQIKVISEKAEKDAPETTKGYFSEEVYMQNTPTAAGIQDSGKQAGEDAIFNKRRTDQTKNTGNTGEVDYLKWQQENGDMSNKNSGYPGNESSFLSQRDKSQLEELRKLGFPSVLEISVEDSVGENSRKTRTDGQSNTIRSRKQTYGEGLEFVLEEENLEPYKDINNNQENIDELSGAVKVDSMEMKKSSKGEKIKASAMPIVEDDTAQTKTNTKTVENYDGSPNDIQNEYNGELQSVTCIEEFQEIISNMHEKKNEEEALIAQAQAKISESNILQVFSNEKGELQHVEESQEIVNNVQEKKIEKEALTEQAQAKISESTTQQVFSNESNEGEIPIVKTESKAEKKSEEEALIVQPQVKISESNPLQVHSNENGEPQQVVRIEESQEITKNLQEKKSEGGTLIAQPHAKIIESTTVQVFSNESNEGEIPIIKSESKAEKKSEEVTLISQSQAKISESNTRVHLNENGEPQHVARIEESQEITNNLQEKKSEGEILIAQPQTKISESTTAQVFSNESNEREILIVKTESKTEKKSEEETLSPYAQAKISESNTRHDHLNENGESQHVVRIEESQEFISNLQEKKSEEEALIVQPQAKTSELNPLQVFSNENGEPKHVARIEKSQEITNNLREKKSEEETLITHVQTNISESATAQVFSNESNEGEIPIVKNESNAEKKSEEETLISQSQAKISESSTLQAFSNEKEPTVQAESKSNEVIHERQQDSEFLSIQTRVDKAGIEQSEHPRSSPSNETTVTVNDYTFKDQSEIKQLQQNNMQVTSITNPDAEATTFATQKEQTSHISEIKTNNQHLQQANRPSSNDKLDIVQMNSTAGSELAKEQEVIASINSSTQHQNETDIAAQNRTNTENSQQESKEHKPITNSEIGLSEINPSRTTKTANPEKPIQNTNEDNAGVSTESHARPSTADNAGLSTEKLNGDQQLPKPAALNNQNKETKNPNSKPLETEVAVAFEELKTAEEAKLSNRATQEEQETLILEDEHFEEYFSSTPSGTTSTLGKSSNNTKEKVLKATNSEEPKPSTAQMDHSTHTPANPGLVGTQNKTSATVNNTKTVEKGAHEEAKKEEKRPQSGQVINKIENGRAQTITDKPRFGFKYPSQFSQFSEVKMSSNPSEFKPPSQKVDKDALSDLLKEVKQTNIAELKRTLTTVTTDEPKLEEETPIHHVLQLMEQAESFTKVTQHAKAIEVAKDAYKTIESFKPQNDDETYQQESLRLYCSNYLSVEYFNTKDYKTALQWAFTTLKEDPYNIQALYKAYQCERKLGKNSEAKRRIQAVKKVLCSPMLMLQSQSQNTVIEAFGYMRDISSITNPSNSDPNDMRFDDDELATFHNIL